MTATLICVFPPTEAQLTGFTEFVRRQSGAEEVTIDVKMDESLGSGFILKRSVSVERAQKEHLEKMKQQAEKGSPDRTRTG